MKLYIHTNWIGYKMLISHPTGNISLNYGEPYLNNCIFMKPIQAEKNPWALKSGDMLNLYLKDLKEVQNPNDILKNLL